MIVEILYSYICDKQFIYQLAATITTYSIISTVLFAQKRLKRYKLFKYYGIPGPEPRLLDGSLYMYTPEKAGYLVDKKFRDKYGKYYGIFIGDEPSIVISDLDLLKKVFLEKMSSFKERSIVFIDTPIAKSVLFSSRWKYMRKIMSPEFSAYSMRGNSSTEFIEDSIKLMLEYIEDKFSHIKDNEKNHESKDGLLTTNKRILIDMHDLMKATALHLISNMAVQLPDVQVKEDENNVKSLDSYLSACDKGVVIYAIRFPFLKRILTFLARNFEQGTTMRLIHQGLNQRIDENLKRLSNPKSNKLRTDQIQLIDTLIKLHHEGKLSRDEVMGNAEAILIAGYDTTSTTLSYIFWVLGKHHDVQEKLRAELIAHGVESKYLEQVINETMRLYPTVISFTTRLATEMAVIDEQLTVPQGARVVFNSWLLHRSSEIWPDPIKFDPERFREGVEIHPCAFAPFGLGDRKCLGYQLAKLELKMIICDLLMRYRLNTKAPDDLELDSYAVVLTKPRDKIMVELEKL